MAKWRDIKLNNRSFRSFGFFLKKGVPSYDFANPEIKTIPVEGSVTGSAVWKDDNKSIERTYSFRSIPSEVPFGDESRLRKEFSDWINELKMSSQQVEVRDSENNGYFTYGVISKIEPLTRNFEKCYDFSISIICLPYWYSDEGYNKISKTFSTSDSYQDKRMWLYNTENFVAFPLITISFAPTGNNSIILKTFKAEYTTDVGELVNQFKITNINGNITIDSEQKRSYKTVSNGFIPQDYLLDLANFPTFPFFIKGKNKIEFETTGTGVFTVDVYPRWRCY